jgi:hypothetical protein
MLVGLCVNFFALKAKPKLMTYKWSCLRAVGCGLALLVGSCGSRIPIHTSYDKSTSFEKYNTFALDLTPAELGPLGTHTLEESLRARLGARGLKEVADDQANLLVVCSIATEQKQVRSSVAGRAYFPSNFGRYSGTAGIVQAPEMTEYTYGSLIIDFVDAGSRELVFRGIGRAKVNTEERNAAAINTVVSRVVAAIPRLGQK